MTNKRFNTPHNPKPNFLSSLFRFIIKIVMLTIIGCAIFIVLSDNRQEATSYLGNLISTPFKYAHLMQKDPPQPNSLPNPITEAHLTDTWGAARSGGRTHEGIDIFAERGTPIHSTTEGIVRKVDVNALGGNIVSIVGPGGMSHYYAHLETFADIKEGDWVEAGDIIGYVGDSGNAKGTPPHVHYGIYTQAGAVNPYPLLKK